MNTTADIIRADTGGLVLTCPQCGQRNRLRYERMGETFRCGHCHNEFSPPAEPIELENDAAFQALTSHCPLPVVADFWAPWCGPCKIIAPELAKIADEGAGRWLVVKVNTEEWPGLARQFHVSAIPLVVLFKAGREIARQAGAMPAAALRQFITELI